MPKLRLDTAIVDRGLTASRSLAQQLIAAGSVEVCTAGLWSVVKKASQKVAPEQDVRITDADVMRYVSRAGLKLERVLSHLDLDVSGVTAIDIGQSTGGFTDCLLQYGATKVVGVDVGHDQLASALRSNPAVVCLENINARALPQTLLAEHAPHGFDLGVMDVSFISQTLILPGLKPVIKTGGIFISLVKPQFEVGRENVAKGGIVKNTELYSLVEKNIRRAFSTASFEIFLYIESPITGSDGNREFLAVAKRI